MSSFTSPVLFAIWGFYCDICDCHILPARTWTPALNVCTQLTHALSRKVLSLTKRKDKIYKTKIDNIKKSFRNYITIWNMGRNNNENKRTELIIIIIIIMTIIIIIIMSCRQHGYPWPSLATSLHRSSLLAGRQGYIPYPPRAAVCRFKLATPAFARPCDGVHKRTSLMSSSLLL